MEYQFIELSTWEPQPIPEEYLPDYYTKSEVDDLVDAKQDALPDIANNAGKVLTVNSGATGLEWTTPASGGGSSSGGGVKIIDVSEGTSKESFNGSAELLAFGKGVLDGTIAEIPVIAFRINSKELWYLIHIEKLNDMLYCDWYSLETNDIYHNYYNPNVEQWRDKYEQYTYGAVIKPPTGGNVGDVLSIKSTSSYGKFYEWTTPSSSGGASYTAGNGISISNNEISVDTSVVATKTDLSAKQDTLPTTPAADGTYFLTTTVSSGTSTQSWVSIPAANGNNF